MLWAALGLACTGASGRPADDPVPMPPPMTHAATQRELDDALAHSKASMESKERMAAKLRGETTAFDAGKLTGQAKIDFLEKAARKGDPAAAEQLGELLDTGESLPEDPARAAGYFKAAALGGRRDAAHSLGVDYSTGRGVRRDYREALAWMIVARARGDDSDIEEQLRTFLAGSEYRGIIASAEARAKELQAKHTVEEIVAALPPPAPLVFDPTATAQTVDASSLSSSSPASAADASAAPEVVVYTINGERLTWPTLTDLRQAAEKGDATALDGLGRVLLAGKLVTADPLQALSAFERSAAGGDVDAAYELSGLYATSTEVVHDDAKAFAYCTQAANGGVLPAMVNLGVFYTNGRGTARDLVKGLAWLSVAKHFGVNSVQEKRLRQFLDRNHPEDIAKAEALAAKLIPQVEAKMH